MGAPALEVGYTSATTGRGDHEVHKGHVVAMGGKKTSVHVEVLLVKWKTLYLEYLFRIVFRLRITTIRFIL
jgi:hypothetical protein